MKINKLEQTFHWLKHYGKWKGISLFFLFLVLNFQTANALDDVNEIILNPNGSLDPIIGYDEVSIEIIVAGYFRFEADALITNKRLAYINVEELFKKLGIYCQPESNGNILRGFIENERIPYSIDANLKQIIIGDKTITSDNGIVKELGATYIEIGVLSEAFNMQMIFNFRSLSIKLQVGFELPFVKQARLEKMRKNVTKLQLNEVETFDTIIGRNYHLFKGGALDWAVNSFQSEDTKPNNRYYLGLGSELFYGEFRVSLNYLEKMKFERRQFYYNWRFIDNDKKYVKQVQVGKIGTQAIAFLGAPLVGVSFNNSPNTVRKAKGTYIISDYTEPNWTVELYINDALVDYTSSDASGFYLFNVPIVYGYTTLTLRFYGPLGEERVEERTQNTPYTFMPKKVLEYNVAGGILENDDGSTFVRSEVNYGVSRFLTIGAGVEYLSSIPEQPFIPFANAAFQPFSEMIVNFKYAHNVSFKGLLNYYFGKSAFLEVEYKNFAKGQEVTLDNMDEVKRVQVSLPFKLNKFRGNTKLSFNQFVYDAFNFSQVDALISTSYKNNSANLSFASNWISEERAFITSTLVLSRRFKNGFILRPSIQYNLSENNTMRLRAEVEKRADKISFSAAYERNIQFGTNNISFSIRYDLPFARASLNSFYNNNQLGVSQNAQGSLAFGAGNGAVNVDYNSAIGKGGILCYPFLDLNENNTKDSNEPRVFVKNAKIVGGRINSIKNDSILRISDLNSFVKYKLTFDDGELDNIGWKFKHNTYQVLVDPNQYKKIEIPILVYGEVTGMVYLKKGENTIGQGRISIQIYDTAGHKVAETLSESDGYYSYLGLKPKDYILRIEKAQLKKLGYRAAPIEQKVTIRPLIKGDFVENLNFVLHSNTEI
ncbi:hypothetical protein [Polaribacter sp. IC063]|uniref:hypothetical protein n=1 Tax=Polaribacter sp. IC063 TaxID=57031 RepID=UPI0011BE0686|nr:hypothetical protein [Polaribacter sp. IC063]TXD52016.1 hypothetical protein ES043_09845 [Polaribacter sp. IC063]